MFFQKVHNSQHPRLGANIRGEYGESIVRSFFVRSGYRVLTASEHYPYDFIIERHGKMARIQVKTTMASLEPGVYPSSDFNKTLEFDFAAILTGDGSVYFIPKDKMKFEDRRDSSRFKLYPKYSNFKVAQFNDFWEFKLGGL